MSRLSIKGIVIGGVVDVVMTGFLGIPFAVYVVLKFDLIHVPKDQLKSAITSAVHGDVPVYVAQLVIGILCSALGGYVAAWLANRDELLNGALSSFLCISIGFYSMVSAAKASHPSEMQILQLFASPCWALVGGEVKRRQRRTSGAVLT